MRKILFICKKRKDKDLEMNEFEVTLETLLHYNKMILSARRHFKHWKRLAAWQDS